MEDLTQGQRIANYSVEYRVRGSSEWKILVPAVAARNATGGYGHGSYGDRPDGHDPRDQHVGYGKTPLTASSFFTFFPFFFSC